MVKEAIRRGKEINKQLRTSAKEGQGRRILLLARVNQANPHSLSICNSFTIPAGSLMKSSSPIMILSV